MDIKPMHLRREAYLAAFPRRTADETSIAEDGYNHGVHDVLDTIQEVASAPHSAVYNSKSVTGLIDLIRRQFNMPPLPPSGVHDPWCKHVTGVERKEQPCSVCDGDIYEHELEWRRKLANSPRGDNVHDKGFERWLIARLDKAEGR